MRLEHSELIATGKERSNEDVLQTRLLARRIENELLLLLDGLLFGLLLGDRVGALLELLNVLERLGERSLVREAIDQLTDEGRSRSMGLGKHAA